MFESYDKIKTRRVETDEPERRTELIFDPERDIPEEIWDEATRNLESYRQSQNWERFLELATWMKTLNKPVNISDAEWREIAEILRRDAITTGDKLMDEIKHLSWLRNAAHAKFLGPKVQLDYTLPGGLEDRLRDPSRMNNWAYVYYLDVLKNLDPLRFELTEDESKRVLAIKEEALKKENGYWCVTAAAAIEDLIPGRVKLTREKIEDLKNNWIDSDDIVRTLETAVGLKKLSEMLIEPKTGDNIPPQPTRRKF